ncbi:MAG: hypothetical protein WC518_01055 [Patescibacteria group bacterium]
MFSNKKFLKRSLSLFSLVLILVLAAGILGGCGQNNDEEDYGANINEEEVATPDNINTEEIDTNQNAGADETNQPVVEEVNVDAEINQLDASIQGVSPDDFKDDGLSNKELGI